MGSDPVGLAVARQPSLSHVIRTMGPDEEKK